MGDKVLKAFGTVFSVTLFIFVAAVISGTILWLVWPIAVSAAFPALVASGALAAKLTWWQSVLVTWLFNKIISVSVNGLI